MTARPPDQDAPRARRASAADNGAGGGRRGDGRSGWLLVTISGAGLLAGLLIVLLALPRWLTSPPQKPDAPATTPAGDVARQISATLYTVSDDGEFLTGSAHQVPLGESPAEQARRILEAQLAPPPSGAISPIPAGVSVRGLYLTARGDAYVDLSRDIMTKHPGGSLNEALTVYAIVNVLTSNVREITAVQILVEGAQVDSLAGHIDLRQPLAAGTRWIQKGQ